MKNLIWDQDVPLFIPHRNTVGTLCTSPLFLCDGQILFFKDENEKEMEIESKEKTKLEQFSKKHKL